jgi:hypothetical protein
LGSRVSDASGAVVVMGRVQLLLGRVDGRVQGVGVQKVPSHHILVCPVLVPFEVSRKGSRVRVGKDYATAAERKRHRPQTFAAPLPCLPQ